MHAQISATIAPIKPSQIGAAVELLRLTLIDDGVAPIAVTVPYASAWIGGGAPLLGAWIAEPLVGYAMIERDPSPSPFGVAGLSVLRRFRRKGLGEQLMRALLADVRCDSEIGEVWLSVAPDNLPARALYEKLCFVERPDPPPTMFVPTKYLTMFWRPHR